MHFLGEYYYVLPRLFQIFLLKWKMLRQKENVFPHEWTGKAQCFRHWTVKIVMISC